VEIPRGPLAEEKVIRWNEKRPMIGATALVADVQLVSPTKLSFAAPIEELVWSVDFEARESNPRLVLHLGAQKSSTEVTKMREARLTYFNDQVTMVEEKKLYNMFRDEDANNLKPGGNKNNLGRSKLLNSATLYKQHYDSRYKFLTDWSASLKDNPVIELYPIQTPLTPNNPHDERWDATPARR
jgi:hypothetical protein